MSDNPFESDDDMEGQASSLSSRPSPLPIEASDPEMDEELRLPDELTGISQRDRKELYKFKQQHTEVLTIFSSFSFLQAIGRLNMRTR
jgi:hypothetical protein